MGVLSRFRFLMASNVNALLNRSENVEKSLDEYMRNVNGELGKVKAETASILTAESRAKRALDECMAEISKLQRYAEKSVQSGNEDQALKFLEQKSAEAGKVAELQAAYNTAAANAAKMKVLQEKLTADINLLEARRMAIKVKLAAAEAQQKINAVGTSSLSYSSMFDELEEKAERAYDEAMALAELRRDAENDIDAKFAMYEMTKEAKPEEELAELKEKLKR